jgi:1-acyl-sn-glycerol-3-phosphate acyltransferase
MIGKLFYLCPSCFEEDTLIQEDNFIKCPQCKTIFPFEKGKISLKERYYSIIEFYSLVRQTLSVHKSNTDNMLRVSKMAILRQGIRQIPFRNYDNYLSIIESPVEVDRGVLIFKAEALIFRGKAKDWSFQKSRISSFTTNSKYFEFKIRDIPFFQIYFEEESALKYEDLFLKWFQMDSASDTIIEHQPRIIKRAPPPSTILLRHNDIENWNSKERFNIFELLFHVFIGLPIVWFLKWRTNLEFVNEEIIPVAGPFMLLMNHESYLDPILMLTLSPRRIGFFTKSTSFTSQLFQLLFRSYRALPNRRYEIDPSVVRQALVRIKKGNGIGVFPEGERTWDGKLLPFKYNTIRFLRSVQVPIVIVKISGAFEVLPRWSHKLHKGNIKIEVQRCFSLIPDGWDIGDLKHELEQFYLNDT